MLAACVTGFLLLAGCGSDATPSKTTDDGGAITSAAEDDVELACRRDDGPTLGADDNQLSASMTRVPSDMTPFRCLRLLNAADVSSAGHDVRIVNVMHDGSNTPASSKQLHIPLHEIKTKAFLRDRSLAIVSDGKRFAALEKECQDIKASGIEDVIAVLPELVQLSAGSDGLSLSVEKMSPLEFIAERAYGHWQFVNLSSDEDLRSPLFLSLDTTDRNNINMKQQASRAGLERTLIVTDGDDLPDADFLTGLSGYRGQVFVLDGGLLGLRRYQSEATAMVRALARPRINERGCAG